jgi:uncharacterized membrane protein (DUF106 family)
MKKFIIAISIGLIISSCQDTCPADDVNDLAKCMCEDTKAYSEAVNSGDTEKIDELDRKMQIADEEVAAELDKGTYTAQELQIALTEVECD